MRLFHLKKNYLVKIDEGVRRRLVHRQLSEFTSFNKMTLPRLRDFNDDTMRMIREEKVKNVVLCEYL